MLMREKRLHPETVGDLKAALADCPDDMDVYDSLGAVIVMDLKVVDGKQVIIIR